jgi:hypothetical protein
MSSISCRELQDDVDALRAVISCFQGHSYEALTAAEGVDALEERAFLIGALDALGYELCSPFTRPSERRT